MTRGETEFVSALRTQLRERIGESRYQFWFGDSVQWASNSHQFCVSAPSQFALDWLQRNFRRDILACLRELGSKQPLCFQVGRPSENSEPAEGGNDAGSSPPNSTKPLGVKPHGPTRAHPEHYASPDNNSAQNASSSLREIAEQALKNTSAAENAATQGNGRGPARAGGDNSRDPRPRVRGGNAQGPPPSSRRKFASLADFVIGDCNRAAAKAAELILDQPGAFSPLLIHGPPAVGKSHLLEGIWSQARAAGCRAIFLTAEQFTTSYVGACHGGGMPNFRRKHRDVDMLLIDDVQFIAGKKRTAEELLHTINALVRDGRQIVLSAEAAPAELAGFGPELQTRLQAGLACAVARPELSVRVGVVRRFARQRSIELTEGVVKFVAEKIDSHARELSGAVNQLLAAHLSTGQPVNVDLAAQVLGETIRASHPPVHLKEIEQAVCEEFQLEPRQLRSDKKTREVTQPRMLAMWLARRHTGAALSEIGDFFGGRSHSTVVSAQKKVNEWVASKRPLRSSAGERTAEDAIRRLEERLRVG